MDETFSIDQTFIRKLSDIVIANFQNENFGVNTLVRETGLSRSYIHRKLKAARKQNISQFICEVRLKRAMELLQQRAGHASEIAYKVGFGSPSYFNKCFHKYYGFPPGEVKKIEFTNNETPLEGVAIHREISDQSSVTSGNTQTGIIRHRRKVLFLSSALALVVLGIVWIFYNYNIKGSNFINIFHQEGMESSLIVLPFKNLSDDSDNQYFADGIMEDILNNLFLVSELRVVSRTTSEHFRETSLTAREIARKVNARNVLEGSVRRYGDKTRISIQLIDASRDLHLWSVNYDAELTDILGFQGEIALQVAYKLDAVISEKEISQIKKISTRNPEAYDHYLRARFILHKANSEQRSDFSQEGVMNCIQSYEKAIAADASFAEAYAGLANAWFNVSAWGWYQPYFEGIQNARNFSAKALELDPNCAEAHAVKGVYLIYPDRRFEEGRKELLFSLHLNPNFATAHQWYAQLLMITGPIEEARLHIDRALELEPFFWVIQNLNAWIYYFEEKYDKAISACFVARDLKPDFIENYWLFFLNYAKLGEGEKAKKTLQTIAGLYPGAPEYPDEIMNAYKESGIKGLFSWLIDINAHKPIPVPGMSGDPFYIAWWHAISGNRDESVYWLERNMETNLKLYHYFNLITTNPDFDFLRDDPRFLAIIEELGLTPYHTKPARILH